MVLAATMPCACSGLSLYTKSRQAFFPRRREKRIFAKYSAEKSSYQLLGVTSGTSFVGSTWLFTRCPCCRT